MMLKFYAKGDGIVREPGVIEIIGTDPHYVGRKKLALPNGRFCYPAVEEPFEVDAETDAGRRLCEVTKRDGALWPADKATADACDVKYIPVEYDRGEWVPKKPASLKA